MVACSSKKILAISGMNLLYNIVLIVGCIFSTQTMKRYEVQINAKLEQECIDEPQSVLIEFEIVNNENIPLYISAVGLLFEMEVLDQAGNRVNPIRKIEANTLGTQDYFLIQPKSSSSIQIPTRFFDQFMLGPDVTYALRSMYSNTLDNKKDKNVKTIKGDIPISTLYFKKCG